MRLSIIVPVYNMAGDGKLNYCLDSLLAQTVKDYEILAVDDCSTDNSLEILRQYEKDHPETIKVITSPQNRHQGGAKNKGLKAAQGEWVGFIDSDDWISPDMYEKLITRAEETGADLVGCDYSLVTEHSFEVGKIVANSRDDQAGVLDTARRKSLILDGGSLCVKIYKRERILKDGLFFPEGIFYEDNAVGNAYLVGAGHFEYVKEPLYYYYQHQASTVHTVTRQRCEDRLEASRIMLKQAKELGFYEECRDEIDYKFIMLFYLNTVFSYVRDGKKVSVKFVRAIGRELTAILPNFRENPYYRERISEEEKRMTELELKHTFLFVCYYRLLWTYRRLRKK